MLPHVPVKTTNYSRNLDSHVQTHHQHLPQADKKIFEWAWVTSSPTYTTANLKHCELFCSFLLSPSTSLYVKMGCEQFQVFCHACCIVDKPQAFPPPRFKNKQMPAAISVASGDLCMWKESLLFCKPGLGAICF